MLVSAVLRGAALAALLVPSAGLAQSAPTAQLPPTSKAAPPPASPAAAQPAAPGPSAAEVRAWARDNGIPVPARGKLGPDVWDAWRDAHRG